MIREFFELYSLVLERIKIVPSINGRIAKKIVVLKKYRKFGILE